MRHSDYFLKDAKGVIHVGASRGQEREDYKDLDVIWIEPIPEVFKKLERNIREFPKQTAIQALITDKDNQEYTFHISDNKGESSSIFEFKGHKELWPHINFVKTINLKSITLDSLLYKEKVDVSKYDTLVLDTQGSELLVLMGATLILPHIKYVKCEVANFEIYEGCCQLKDINEFLSDFEIIAQRKFNSWTEGKHVMGNGNNCWDMIYRRKL